VAAYAGLMWDWGERLGERLGRANPRVAMPVLLEVCIGGAAAVCMAFVRDGEISQDLVIALTVVGVVSAICHQLYEWRRGRLIIWDPAKRLASEAKGRDLLGTTLLATAAPIGIAVATDNPVVPVVLAIAGGFTLGYLPFLLYVVWILRPAEREGEWL
jgi:hypothetical protein